MENKILAIIQSRSASSRLPKKNFLKFNNITVIEHVVNRLSYSKLIDETIIATTNKKSDDLFVNFLIKKKFKYFRGDSSNVFKRFIDASKLFKGDIIVRITADCPLIDPSIVDKVISQFLSSKAEYSSNICPPTFANGFDVEVFSRNLLLKTKKYIISDHDKEHVTTFFRKSKKIKKINLLNSTNDSYIRLTLDDYNDFKNISIIFKKFKKNFKYNDVIKFINSKNYNAKFYEIRNDFDNLGTGQKLWKKAKSIIPGGNMLISKRSEFFLPDLWPSYYSRAKGSYLWDLDNNKFLDMCLMGVGTNILGYAYNPVDEEVKTAIKKGNMSSLNCPEEVELAEKLISMNNWAGMVKFAKTGAEANSIAVRIARSYSKKDNIAICGYHGWHDWYLSSNLNKNNNLSNHLLDGIYTSGVPKKLKNTVFPFNYNDFETLEKIIKEKNIGVIKMEVKRNINQQKNFLKKIRKISTLNNITLIFDECTSGFRECYGGIYKKFDVIPDIVIYGKAIANGYPLTAVVGKSNIMECANNSFISSTFWTDRIVYVAALKTLENMKKIKSWEYITLKGKQVKKKWIKLANKYNLKINVNGIDALPTFVLLYDDWIKYKTYITQEMLKNRILATNTIYISLAHKNIHFKKYFVVLEKIFKNIEEFENGKDINSRLETIPSQSTFERLN